LRISSQSSQFEFNLPSDFLPREIVDNYNPILEKNWIQYNSVIDYINSTIKSITFPGLAFETPEQRVRYGKKIAHKSSTPVQDIMSAREVQVTFRSVDSDLNYWLLYDIFIKHYLDVVNQYINPFVLTSLDIHRDAIYSIKFFEIISTNLSEITFDYSQQKVNAKDFTMTFKFNYIDIEFLLDKSKVLDNSLWPPNIINK